MALATIVLLGIVLSLGLVPYQRDDAYITYRYAANFAAGHGIVFNVSGPSVEGFSSPLWFLMLSAAAFLGGQDILPRVGVILGLLSFCLLLLSVAFAFGGGKNNEAQCQRGWGLLPMLLLATLPPACYYAATGLETVLFCAVVFIYTAAVAGLLPFSLGIATGIMASWVRPEGIWLLGTGALGLLEANILNIFSTAMICGPWRRHRGLSLIQGQPQMVVPEGNTVIDDRYENKGQRSREALKLFFAPLLGFSLLIGLRFFLFGTLFPNTYWAKQPNLLAGFEYVGLAIIEPRNGIFFSLAFAGFLMGKRRERFFFLAGVSWLGAAVLEGGDWMPLERMLLPANVLLAISASGFGVWMGINLWKKGRRAYPFLSIMVGVFLLVVLLNVHRFLDEVRLAQQTVGTINRETLLLLEWIKKSNARSVGLVDIGEIGFRSGVEIFDLAGLTDARIGRAPGGHLEKEFDFNYLFQERRPEVLVFRLLAPIKGKIITTNIIEGQIMRDPRFSSQYRFVQKIIPQYPRDPYYGLLIFQRQDLG